MSQFADICIFSMHEFSSKAFCAHGRLIIFEGSSVLRFCLCIGRLHFSWYCVLVFVTRHISNFIFSGIDPRIGHFVVRVSRKYQFVEFHEVKIFLFVAGAPLDCVAFLLSIAYTAQLHSSCTWVCQWQLQLMQCKYVSPFHGEDQAKLLTTIFMSTSN